MLPPCDMILFMSSDEKKLWTRVQEAFVLRKSILIEESERKAAEKLVKASKCFWSVDFNHIMAYSKDETPVCE